MVSKQAFEEALDLLHRHRGALQLTAEVDPTALRELAHDIAEQTGLADEVALRVIEDELGVKPLVPPEPLRKGVTMLDMPRYQEPGPEASSTDE